ncbi:MAG TPA: flippase [Bacteroidota bacterium]|jgi:O-antigen/teichoic acid export membrane protein|nr:flippase [Bacteroidota bacterium]
MKSDVATSITKNTSVMMGSQMITWVSSFVLMLFLPRYLGSEDYGKLYLAISIGTMFQIVIDFGGNYLIPKGVARCPEDASQLATNCVGVRMVLWFGSLVTMAILGHFAGYTAEVQILIIILGIAKLWECVGGVFRNCIQGFEAMEYSSIAAIGERVVLMLAAVTALVLGAHSVIIAVIMAISTLVGSALNFRYFRRFVPRMGRIQWDAVKMLMKRGLPYFLYSVFATIYYRIDAVMLSLMVPGVVVGWYGAAHRFFDIFMFLPSIFTTAIFPILSRLSMKEDETQVQTTTKSIEFIVLAGIPISVIVFGYAEHVIQFFFGLQEYAPSVTILKIFSLGLLLVYIDMVLGTTLFATDKQRQWTVVAFAALLLNPIMNYFMIPYTQTHLSNGGIGAAIATLITELAVFIAAVALVPKSILGALNIPVLLKGAAAGGLMAISAALMTHSGIPWMGQGMIACGIYVLSLLLSKTLNPKEIGFLKRFFSLRNLRRVFFPEKEFVS